MSRKGLGNVFPAAFSPQILPIWSITNRRPLRPGDVTSCTGDTNPVAISSTSIPIDAPIGLGPTAATGASSRVGSVDGDGTPTGSAHAMTAVSTSIVVACGRCIEDLLR